MARCDDRVWPTVGARKVRCVNRAGDGLTITMTAAYRDFWSRSGG
jgi:hypothetical protein